MARITELRLDNVRCFAGEQSAKLRRITLLVGPNGSGKSTFLGCYRTLTILSDLNDLGDGNYFNDAPYRMGTFRNIARKGHETFTVSGRFDKHCYSGASFTFDSGKSEMPREHRIRLDFVNADQAEQHLEITRAHQPRDILRFDGPGFRFDLERSMISFVQISTWLSRYVRHGHLPYAGDLRTFRRSRALRESESDQEIRFGKFVTLLRSGLPLPAEPSLKVEAMDPAPLPRQRLYDAVPAALENLDEEGSLFLSEFGRKLDLWRDVRVRRDAEGRVEILIGTPNGPFSIVDVGYGVASLLPLVRSLYKRPAETTFLLQHPEVHLHPESQANLAELIVESNRNFVIETHSDHFLDRFRICVMQKKLAPEDMSIVYFEPTPDGSRSSIHNIRFDDNAELLDAPDGYRNFFLAETRRLLGFDQEND